MNASLVAFLALPLVTGAASSLWAPITRVTWNGMAALNAISYVGIWIVMTALRREDPGLPEAVRVLGWWPIVTYVALCGAVSTGWFVAHHSTHVVWIAVGEMAWPACVLACTLLLVRWTSLPVELPRIGPWHAIWGAFIAIGVVGFAVTEVKS